MAKFAVKYPDEEFVQRAVAQIPWGHNIVLLDKFSDFAVRKWYIEKTQENGWSRNVLVHQIESGLYERQAIAQKISNFESLLPAPQSELAVQTMKDPYVFDFIPFKEDMVERDIENALVKDVTAWDIENFEGAIGFSVKTTVKRGGYVKNVNVFDSVLPNIRLSTAYDCNNDGEGAKTLTEITDVHFENNVILGVGTKIIHGDENRNRIEWVDIPSIICRGFNDKERMKNITFKNNFFKKKDGERLHNFEWKNLNGLTIENLTTLD